MRSSQPPPFHPFFENLVGGSTPPSRKGECTLCILNFKGIKAVKIFHENFTKKTIATKVITTFLALILILSNFIFNSKHFLQIKVCANIFLDHVERKYMYPLIKGKSSGYLRYINNIFLIWKETKSELDQFFKDLNKKHPSIKFDYKASKNCVTFLDTEIYLHNGKLHTKICRRETDWQHYLLIKSEHPKSLKDSLPYSQAIQIKQISSNQVDLNNLKERKSTFIKQGYHPSLINEHLEWISYLTELTLFLKEAHNKNQTKYLP